jgi:PAS domain S-box-containing protein
MRNTAQILLVEDSTTQAEKLRHQLESHGFGVTVAPTGEQALERAVEARPDLVISDILMPGIDGYELCRRLKSREDLQSVPVILLTSLADPEDVLLGLESGADNFLTKPYDEDYLVSRIQHVLLNRHLYARQEAQMGVEIHFRGKRHFINADRLQMLNLLLSTYENAVEVNHRLDAAHQELTRLNQELERRVQKRTAALTAEIAERRRTEEALRASEERYRRFFEDDLTGDFVTDANGTILDCNPAFLRILGFDNPAEARGCRLAELYEDPAQADSLLARVGSERRVEQCEQSLRRRDGRAVFVIQNVVGSFDEGGQLTEIKGYLFDITDRKELEQQLFQSQKMDAVGRLAGGVAHDFNNMLMVIQGFLDVLQKQIPAEDKKSRYVGEIRKATERAAGLTQQLLVFSRKQVLAVEELDLNGIVREVAGLLEPVLEGKVHLSLSCEPKLRRIRADRGRLEQVLMNLAVNARDAMLDGGSLTVETANVELTDEHVRHLPNLTPGAYVTLAVSDTGSGMPAEILEHMFEPFFTTKERGKGTGLGLSTVYGIVQQFGGHICCTSEPGAGTSFTIYLPASDLLGGGTNPSGASGGSDG